MLDNTREDRTGSLGEGPDLTGCSREGQDRTGSSGEGQDRKGCSGEGQDMEDAGQDKTIGQTALGRQAGLWAQTYVDEDVIKSGKCEHLQKPKMSHCLPLTSQKRKRTKRTRELEEKKNTQPSYKGITGNSPDMLLPGGKEMSDELKKF
jgi:hypothetical protein